MKTTVRNLIRKNLSFSINENGCKYLLLSGKVIPEFYVLEPYGSLSNISLIEFVKNIDFDKEYEFIISDYSENIHLNDCNLIIMDEKYHNYSKYVCYDGKLITKKQLYTLPSVDIEKIECNTKVLTKIIFKLYNLGVVINRDEKMEFLLSSYKNASVNKKRSKKGKENKNRK